MSRTQRRKVDRNQSLDAYYTTPGLARACIRTLLHDRWVRNPQITRVLEPSSGLGAWVEALLDHGFSPTNTWANDIAFDKLTPRLSGRVLACHTSGLDFLLPNKHWDGFRPDLVVGNPPFNDFGSHLEVAFDRMSPMGVVAYLGPIGWFTARGKQDTRQIWLRRDAVPSHQYLISPRPSFTGGGTDGATYTLTVWAPGARNQHTTTSTLDWSQEADVEKEARKVTRQQRRAS